MEGEWKFFRETEQLCQIGTFKNGKFCSISSQTNQINLADRVEIEHIIKENCKPNRWYLQIL